MEEDLLSQNLVEAETPDVPDFKKLIPAEWKSEVETGTGEKISVCVHGDNRDRKPKQNAQRRRILK